MVFYIALLHSWSVGPVTHITSRDNVTYIFISEISIAYCSTVLTDPNQHIVSCKISEKINSLA
jgi:hypothetical protein